MSDKKLSIEELTAERLKSTEDNIKEMESILALMDEIDQLQSSPGADKRQLEYLQNTVGGYTRVEIADLLEELRERRNRSVTDIEREKNALEAENGNLKGELGQIKDDISKLTNLFTKQIELNKIDNKESETMVKSYADMKEELENLKASIYGSDGVLITDEARQLKAGDNTLMIESIYSGLSADIEALKKKITDELGYTYSQQLAIYEDLSEQMTSISGGLDIKAFEERLTEISQIKATDIKVLEEKIDKLTQLNMDDIADRVAEKLSAKMLTGGSAYAIEGGEDAKIEQLRGDISELKAQLSDMARGKDNSEFGLIDYEIKEYLRSATPTALKDLLIDARNLKNKALKYIENGNTVKGEDIIDGLKARLQSAIVSGSVAIGDIITLMDNYHIPLSINRQKLVSLKGLLFKYEQGSIIPDEELMNDIIRTKKDAFKDAALTVFDKQTFDEIMAEAKGMTLSEVGAEKARKLSTLKKELMSFPLSALFDFEISRVGSDITDTDLLLAEIKSLKEEIKGGGTEEKDDGVAELESLSEDLTRIAKMAELEGEKDGTKKTRGKAKKILRPALSNVSQKEKILQPLSVKKKKKISLSGEQNPDALSNLLVKQLAENMASKINKKK